MLNKAYEVKDQVHIFALEAGAEGLNNFWATDLGRILNGGLYIAGTLAVIFAAFKSIKKFAEGSDTIWKKIQPLVFAIIFATFCVKPTLATSMITAFSGGIESIAGTITELIGKPKKQG
jgi:hypothetical protein